MIGSESFLQTRLMNNLVPSSVEFIMFFDLKQPFLDSIFLNNFIVKMSVFALFYVSNILAILSPNITTAIQEVIITAVMLMV